MKRIFAICGAVLLLCGVLGLFIYINTLNPLSVQLMSIEPSLTPTSTPLPSSAQATPTPLPRFYEIPGGTFVAQTFNNCGPATLSMAMSYWGIQVSQGILGEKMRPYQNQIGNNDDKSISVEEFVLEAKNYGLESLARPNGTVELLKKFVASNIPVIVRTWLHPNEDIGHFRIVRGYNDETRVFIQDDSYEGKNLTYDYDTFLSMWQPFNYGYIIVYPKEKESLVKNILGEEFDEKKSFENSLIRALRDAQGKLDNSLDFSYAHFNLSTAYYYLGEYQKSVNEFEKIEYQLPFRMLWYQIEPIAAYKETGNNDRVFSLTEKILNNNNRAFSELYQLRGEIYLQEGKSEEAKGEFEKALFYNKNFTPAQASLSSL